MFSLVLLVAGFAQIALAKVVYYEWNITYVNAAPDGFERRVIGINGQWPCPSLDVDLGDDVVVNVYNALPDQSTTIHWHGIHQRGTGDMDGASGTSQCPIAPGQRFTYKWKADQPGTYWYHSHAAGQYPDGLWGPLIVHDPNPPFHFDEELTITLTDWYHEEMPDLIHYYQSYQGEAADGTPTPSGGALMNGGKNVSIPVKPGKTYYVHIICPGNYPGHAWLFDDHPQTTVEVDGVYVNPTLVNNLEGQKPLTRVSTGQRQGVLIQTKNSTEKNYAVWDTMDVNMLFINKGIVPPPLDYNTNVTGWLVYNESAPYPDPPIFYELGNADFIDDVTGYTPLDNEPLLEPVDHQIVMDMNSANISGISRFVINNSTFIGADVPSLYTALTVGEQYNNNPVVYGNVNPVILKHNEVVEIVINNLNTNLHPWHLHGHQFQVLERPDPKAGVWPGTYNSSKTPVRRDTIMLQDESYAVIRFRADNPGVWLFHCHIEFHVISGFSATMIEAPEVMTQSQEGISQQHIDVCKAFPMAYEGNAAGNTQDPLNVQGAPSSLNSNDWGSLYPPSGTTASRDVKQTFNPRSYLPKTKLRRTPRSYRNSPVRL